MAGICLIRLGRIRPRGVPAFCGVSSENAAHRIAVEWDDATGTREGVYIPRRDTSSRLNVLAGGRVFPGEHRRARFEVHESEREFRVALLGEGVALRVEARLAARLPEGSVFASLAEASAFFEAGALGYSATERADRFDGLELRSLSWKVEPLEVTYVDSSFFSDAARFPPGAIEFDC